MIKTISKVIGDEVSLTLTISKKEGIITMLVKPTAKVDDPAFKNLSPVSITGDEETVQKELESFLSSEIVSDLKSTISGVAEFEKNAEKAAEENKAAQEIKDKMKKLIDKFSKAVTDIKNSDDKKGFDKAEKLRSEILELNPKINTKAYKEVSKGFDELIENAKPKAETADMFSAEAMLGKDDKIDPDVEARGKDSRAIEHGAGATVFTEEKIEAIQQDNFDKLEQSNPEENGDTEITEDF